MRPTLSLGAFWISRSSNARARQNGMFTLFEDGLRKVAAGTTSLEEVLRVTLDQQDEDNVAGAVPELDLTAS